MSVRKLSPTANLLRTSRLFALPKALPRPTADFTGTANFESDTATTPFPTHPAIETTESSLGRGDWGLKRPLPLRSTTRTSTPTIRIDNVDSIDYITDFASAAEHTRTLDKWQEIDMPLSTIASGQKLGGTQPAPESVFESENDNTAINEDDSQARWRFQGPWIAGLDEGEFKSYLANKVGKRKFEFRKFLRERLARAQEVVRRRELAERGADSSDVEARQPDQSISEEALDLYIRRLRTDNDSMEQIISEFLDLPREKRVKAGPSEGSIYNEQGPPTTHPSAGLSYLRTASHIYNHPLHGPQDDKKPVQARVLVPQGEYGKLKRRAVLGVAGVVTEDKQMPFLAGDRTVALEKFDPDVPGGSKVWVEPQRADINVDGKIQLAFQEAQNSAIRVLNGDQEGNKKKPQAATAIASHQPLPESVPSRPSVGKNKARGYGLDDM